MTRKELINLSDSKLNSRVKIAGTNYDRRRVVTKDMKRKMNQMYNAGKSIYTIAEHFGVSNDTVKRAVDPIFNEEEKARKRSVYEKYKYTNSYDPNYASEIAEYKRNLIKNNKKLIISVPS